MILVTPHDYKLLNGYHVDYHYTDDSGSLKACHLYTDTPRALRVMLDHIQTPESKHYTHRGAWPAAAGRIVISCHTRPHICVTVSGTPESR